jgi:energy-coupling factor transporter ATP-binding protein EcfA2
LVGENSSGKSTFLAVLSALTNSETYPFFPKFNEAPYKLGSYDTIATYKGGKYGRAKSFSIGHRQTDSSGGTEWDVLAQYTSNRGQVELSKFVFRSDRADFDLSVSDNASSQYKAKLTARRDDHDEIVHQFVVDRRASAESQFDIRFALYRSILSSDARVDLALAEALNHVTTSVSPVRSLSIAPIRTKPSRTYDQISEDYDPEGQHIPFVLARLLGKGASSQDRDTLVKGLKTFGKESGLFSQIGVKQLGSKVGDPFQIMVTPSGRPANLLDVGYGVSQALPIVVQSILVDRPLLILLQQPEVHLHPKAQAALGTFFVQQVTQAQRRFVIETHSDFIIDRIRQEVAAGNIAKEMVRILFFRKQEFDTNIYRLDLDDLGNIVGAPSGYREFFLREELNLFSKTGGTT